MILGLNHTPFCGVDLGCRRIIKECRRARGDSVDEFVGRNVVVNDDVSRDLGIRLGVTNVETSGDDGLTLISGNGAGTDTMLNSALENASVRLHMSTVSLSELLDRAAAIPGAPPWYRSAAAVWVPRIPWNSPSRAPYTQC